MPLEAARALAWRLRRQALDPPTATTAADVARRVLALRGWPTEMADLAVGVRQAAPRSGDLARALDAGEVVRSYAFRGGSYAFAPEIAALVLSVRTATRVWETRRWQQQGGFELDDWEPLRGEVCAALADGPRTRDEIATSLAQTPLAHLAAAARGAGADSLYKPLHWWGDICFGPEREGGATFRLLRDDPRWPGLPAIDDAGPALIVRYLGAYGPATGTNLHYWLTEGLGVPRRRVQQWLAGDDLRDQVVTLSLDGEDAYLLGDDVAELEATGPSPVVRLLPAFDPWILGPGTADARLVAPHRRALLSRGDNPVIRGGVVAGTWRLRGTTITVSWFGETGETPSDALEEEGHRLSRVYARDLDVAVSVI